MWQRCEAGDGDLIELAGVLETAAPLLPDLGDLTKTVRLAADDRDIQERMASLQKVVKKLLDTDIEKVAVKDVTELCEVWQSTEASIASAVSEELQADLGECVVLVYEWLAHIMGPDVEDDGLESLDVQAILGFVTKLEEVCLWGLFKGHNSRASSCRH